MTSTRRHLIFQGVADASSVRGGEAMWTGPLNRTGWLAEDGITETAYTLDTYDPVSGRLLSSRNRDGHTTLYRYDTVGRIFEVESPGGIVLRTLYNADGDLWKREQSAGGITRTTTYHTDVEGRTTQVVYPDGSSESTAYAQGADQRETHHTNRHGALSVATQSPAGHTVKVRAGGWTLRKAAHDSGGRVISSTSAEGIVTQLSYTNTLKTVAEIYGDHLPVIQNILEPDLDPNETRGVMVQTSTLADGSSSSTIIGAQGALTLLSRAGERTSMVYDSLGNLVAQIDNAGQSTRYAYNPQGAMTDLWDQNNSHTRWEYNDQGRLAKKIYADQTEHRYTYHPGGALASRTDARNRTTHYSYNSNGQLTLVDYPNDTDIAYTYDAFGQRLTATHAGGTNIYTYDAFGSLDTETPAGPDSPVLDYTYTQGRLTGLTSSGPSGQTIAWAYDPLGRLTNITQNARSFSYAYEGASPKMDTQAFGDTLLVDNTYDALGRLIQKENFNPATGLPLSSYAYTLNDSDQRTRCTRSDGTYIDYSYDAIGQVTGAERRFTEQPQTKDYAYTHAYAYDPAGNPVTRTQTGQTRKYTFNNLNQFISATSPGKTDVAGRLVRNAGDPVAITVNGLPAEVNLMSTPATNGTETISWHRKGLPLEPGSNEFDLHASNNAGAVIEETHEVTLAPAPVFTYDANGNMISDGHFNYTWNDENRLIVAEPVTPVENSRKVENLFDHQGRRVVRKVFTLNNAAYTLSSTTRYVYQGWNVLHESTDHTQASDVETTYIWGLDLSGSLQGAGGVGGLLAVTRTEAGTTTTRLPAYDGNGNVMQYCDASSGTTVAEYDYDPFGREVVKMGPSAEQLTYRFSTKPMCDVTGFNYYGFRFYSPEFGRWPNRDPIGERGGIGLFTYTENGAIIKIDILGLQDGDSDYLPPRYRVIIEKNAFGPKCRIAFDVNEKWHEDLVDPGKKEAVRHQDHSSYSVSGDLKNSCSLKITSSIAYSGQVEDKYLDDFEAAIEAAWGNKIKLCCKKSCCGCSEVRIGVDVVFAKLDGDGGFPGQLPPGFNSSNFHSISFTNEPGLRHNQNQWSAYSTKVNVHEFGHVLGAIDMYGKVNGVDFEAYSGIDDVAMDDLIMHDHVQGAKVVPTNFLDFFNNLSSNVSNGLGECKMVRSETPCPQGARDEFGNL